MSVELVAEFRSEVDRILRAVETGKEGKKQAKALHNAADVLGEIGEDVLSIHVSEVAQALEASAGGSTPETDKLRNRVRGLVDAEIMDDDVTAEARQLVEWYNAATKSGSARGEGDSVPDLPGVTVKVSCQEHGVIATQGQKRGAYWNSLRWECKKHDKEKHGAFDLEDKEIWKFGKSAISDPGVETIEIGKYQLTKV